jgi:hypothetical protein
MTAVTILFCAPFAAAVNFPVLYLTFSRPCPILKHLSAGVSLKAGDYLKSRRRRSALRKKTQIAENSDP